MGNSVIELRANFAQRIDGLIKLAIEMKYKNIEKVASNIFIRIKDDAFRITVVGEFNRGKSTLINALIEEDLIPTAARETTATINVIGFNDTVHITIVDADAVRKEISPTKEAFKSYTSLKEFDPATIHHVEIECPSNLLKDNVYLIDTPGVNDLSQQRLEITYGYMPLSDATIIILDATHPFTNSEKSFVQDHILKNNVPTLFFLINKIDLIDQDKIELVINDVKKKVTETLNIIDVIVFPISAELACKGIFTNNKSIIDKSEILAFKEKLLEFVTGSNRSVSLLKWTQLQIIGLIQLFVDEIDIEISQSQKSIEELNNQLQTLSKNKDGFLKELNEILKYIDTDSEALDSRIETTLLNRYKELYEILELEIDSERGDLSFYAEKILPFKYNQNMKQWLENNYESIEEFLNFTTTNSISAFQNSFSKAPLMTQINNKEDFVNSSKMKSFQIGGKDKLKKTNKIAIAGGAILFGSITIATGGLGALIIPHLIIPSLIGGSFAKGIVAPLLTKNILEDQKKELKQLLQTIMKSEFEATGKKLRDHCSEYYSHLKEDINNEFHRVFEEVSFEIQGKIDDNSSSDDELLFRAKKLNSTREHLIVLRKEIEELQISGVIGK